MKFFIYIVACVAVFAFPASLYGSKTVALGEIFSALGNRDRRVRAEGLLSAVEKNPAYCENILAYLETDLNNLPIEKSLAARLLTLWKNNPGNMKIALLAFNYCQRANSNEKELFTLLEKSFSVVNFAALQKKPDMLITFKLCNDYLQMLLDTGNFDAGDKFFERHLANAGKCRELLLGKALHFYWITAFRVEKTAPHFRDHNKNQGVWTKKYNEILTQLRAGEKNLNYTDSAARLQLYLSHRLPETPSYARHFYNKFKSHDDKIREITGFIIQTVVQHQDTLLLGEVINLLDSEPLMQVQFYSLCGDSANIRKIMENLSGNQKQIAQFHLLFTEKKYEETAELFTSISKFLPLNYFTATAISTSIFAGKKQHCWYKMRDFCAGKINSPEIANALAYTAAEFGIELEYAEKLLISAVNAEPDNHAYLDSLAWCKFKQGKFAEAEQLIAHAMDIALPSEMSPTMLFHAAQIKHALKRDKKIINDLVQTALHINGQSPDIEFDCKAAEIFMEKIK